MLYSVAPTTLQVVDVFYDAVWNLRDSLLVLTSQAQRTPAGIVQDQDTLLNPQRFQTDFNQAAAPFLELTGHDLPQDTHLFYSELEDSLKEIVYPKLNIIAGAWKMLYPNLQNPLEKIPPNEIALRQLIKNNSIDLRDELEMTCIIQAKGLLTELQPMPH